MRYLVILLLLAGCSKEDTQVSPSRSATKPAEPEKPQIKFEPVSFTDLVDNRGKWKSKTISTIVYFNGHLPLQHFADDTGRFSGSLMFTGDGTNTEIPLCVERLALNDVPNVAIGDKLRVQIEIDDVGQTFIVKMTRP